MVARLTARGHVAGLAGQQPFVLHGGPAVVLPPLSIRDACSASVPAVRCLTATHRIRRCCASLTGNSSCGNRAGGADEELDIRGDDHVGVRGRAGGDVIVAQAQHEHNQGKGDHRGHVLLRARGVRHAGGSVHQS
ncbi:hypothetical protein BU14_0246s0003 [Porphyra umbilicalis]|uniref:Uncharacterized protein n=1 Tax=Porphyra umbilicalis TaxID=2786 RepID=A0A1X6P2Y4_PORUM|nr:hypothetical protein BU14_0246s0003 [Porphyra umbilicalis]|eukprot:OSX75214.1 hypothetical protein BU14_0246s0003 [Porphyra umbilicalis]